MRIKIAVLAIVAFAIAGRKTAIFQQRNGLLAPNLQRRCARTYKCEIQRNLKKIFCRLIPSFRVDGHIYYIYIYMLQACGESIALWLSIHRVCLTASTTLGNKQIAVLPSHTYIRF